MMLIAETRPNSRDGVTDCHRVVVLITPQDRDLCLDRKKLRAANRGVAMIVVRAITAAATKPVIGPSPITNDT